MSYLLHHKILGQEDSTKKDLNYESGYLDATLIKNKFNTKHKHSKISIVIYNIKRLTVIGEYIYISFPLY